MAEDTLSAGLDPGVGELSASIELVTTRTRNLELGAGSLARAMASAFSTAVSGAKQLDDVLKTLALRLSDLSLRLALQPLAKSIVGNFNQLFTGFGTGSGSSATNLAAATGAIKPFAAGGVIGTNLAAAMGAIKPFAAGGVIGTPTYFPLAAGGVGLAGEAGPEAIIPLARGPDGRLGVASHGGAAPANVTVVSQGGAAAAANITIAISTPDAASFRRSESYITGQIARAVARGQRSL
jgi:phage-related minor tail protein